MSHFFFTLLVSNINSEIFGPFWRSLRVFQATPPPTANLSITADRLPSNILAIKILIISIDIVFFSVDDRGRRQPLETVRSRTVQMQSGNAFGELLEKGL